MNTDYLKGWDIQEQQRHLPERIRYLSVVPAVDLELDDSIHLSANGHSLLAKRLARCADRLALGNRKEKPPIMFKTPTKIHKN